MTYLFAINSLGLTRHEAVSWVYEVGCHVSGKKKRGTRHILLETDFKLINGRFP